MSNTKKPQSDANRLWGGRFESGPSAVMERINASIDFDKRLYAQDIAGSKAHCTMLMRQEIISDADGRAILDGLETILREIEAGEFEFRIDLEDIHMNVEARLTDLIGPPAGRLHTARSRNDQVATDFRLWVRSSIDEIDNLLADLQRAFLGKAEQFADAIMPGCTHLQAAQPVTIGHHMLAYVEMFDRDRGRMADARRRLNECPLGTAALAGTSFPIDRDVTATALGFERPSANSLDAVSDRDFALEFLGAAAISAMHLTRLAEELVLWSSAQYGFVRLSDAFTTGSSIMPQKKNPDAAELIRGKIGRIAGSFQSLLLTMKGLALTFIKDMQEDKEAVFDATDTLMLCLMATNGMVRDTTFNLPAMEQAAGVGFTTATDFADWLVRALNMPFREAHHVTGQAVRLAEQSGRGLEDLALEELQAVHSAITGDVFSVLGVHNSVASRTSYGGTAPSRVREQIARWQDKLT